MAEGAPVFQVDVNRAEWPEFAALPGIGERLAQRIVTYRETRGPFRSLDDWNDVPGIGPKTIENVGHYLAIDVGSKPWSEPLEGSGHVDER